MNKYLSEDTIAALSTAAGQSAIAVIRLSGGHSSLILEKVFKPSSEVSSRIRHGYIVDGQRKIDEVLCTCFKAPNTYTGEDIVEISVHGNPVIINEVLTLLYKNGARAAGPGEFTYRAFLNGKKDLAEAEAVCDLITSKTETAAAAALNNVSGEFSGKTRNELDLLTKLMAYLEASLDYPQEDIPFLSQEQKTEMINAAIANNQQLLNTYKMSQNLQKGLKAAIIGKPNAGKSSLLNAILGKNRAIVTEFAGTTTDTIEEIIDCRGIPLTVIDTAGIRTHTENSIEVLGQERSKEAANKADILIWVFDSSSPLDKNDLEIAQYLKSLNFKGSVIGVLNKSDLPSKINENDIKTLANYTYIIGVSAKPAAGVERIIDKIAEIAGITEKQNEYLMINSRHFTLLQNVQSALLKVKDIIDSKKEDELACFEAKNAVAALEEILGINAPQDILDTIFGTFCIGK